MEVTIGLAMEIISVEVMVMMLDKMKNKKKTLFPIVHS
ncbi:hypothetical protein OROGR_025659 [Orobanche gracilis]